MAFFSTLNMEAVCFSKTSLNFYKSIWCHTFEVLTLVSSQTLMWEPQSLLNTWAYLPHYFQAQNVALVAEEALYSWRGKE
jgi:hypothetical protein